MHKNQTLSISDSELLTFPSCWSRTLLPKLNPKPSSGLAKLLWSQKYVDMKSTSNSCSNETTLLLVNSWKCLKNKTNEWRGQNQEVARRGQNNMEILAVSTERHGTLSKNHSGAVLWPHNYSSLHWAIDMKSCAWEKSFVGSNVSRGHAYKAHRSPETGILENGIRFWNMLFDKNKAIASAGPRPSILAAAPLRALSTGAPSGCENESSSWRFSIWPLQIPISNWLLFRTTQLLAVALPFEAICITADLHCNINLSLQQLKALPEIENHSSGKGDQNEKMKWMWTRNECRCRHVQRWKCIFLTRICTHMIGGFFTTRMIGRTQTTLGQSNYRRVWFAEHTPRSANQIARTVSPIHFQISVYEIRKDIFICFSSFSKKKTLYRVTTKLLLSPTTNCLQSSQCVQR